MRSLGGVAFFLEKGTRRPPRAEMRDASMSGAGGVPIGVSTLCVPKPLGAVQLVASGILATLPWLGRDVDCKVSASPSSQVPKSAKFMERTGREPDFETLLAHFTRTRFGAR